MENNKQVAISPLNLLGEISAEVNAANKIIKGNKEVVQMLNVAIAKIKTLHKLMGPKGI